MSYTTAKSQPYIPSVCSNRTSDYHPDVPATADDEFESATLDTTGDRFVGATPWVWLNQGGAVAPLARGSVVLIAPANVGDNIRAIVQPAAAGAWKYRCKIPGVTWTPTGDGALCGLLLRNSGNGFMWALGLITNGLWNIAGALFTDFTTYGGSSLGIQANPYFDIVNGSAIINFPHYLEVESDGTTFFFRYSVSGLDGTFFLLASETITDHIGAIDQIGLFMDAANNNAAVMAVDWFRKAA